MHADEVASAQFGEYGEVVGVRLWSGDGVEDANKLVLSRFSERIDELVDDRRVFVIEDLGRSAALAEIEIVRANDGDDVDSRGRSQLSRHGADGRRAAVHDECLVQGRHWVL